MSQTSGFFNAKLDSQGNFDRVYLAEQFATYFSNFISDGVFAHLLDKFIVTANSGFTVNVAAGKAFAKGFWFESDANETLNVDLPDGLLNRKDNVVIRFDFENRVTNIAIVKGTLGTDPDAPKVVRNGLIFELKIAEIFVGASVNSILQSAITDTRSDNNVCGWVTGLVDQISTADLFLQYSQAYNEAIEKMQNDEQSMMSQMNDWFTKQKNEFDAWMSTLTKELNVDGYVNVIEKKFKGQSLDYNITFSTVHFDSSKKLDIVEVFVNGLRVQTFLGNDSVQAASAGNELIIGDYFAVVNFDENGVVAVTYNKVLDVNSFEKVVLTDDNEIIVRVGQFIKGFRS